mgnify:CR=1 FL=1
MTKRLTATEVMASDHRICDECERLIREHLVPQWQDEPDADGWYWVEGLNGPQKIYRLSDERWFVLGIDALKSRVCPIGARPK